MAVLPFISNFINFSVKDNLIYRTCTKIKKIYEITKIDFLDYQGVLAINFLQSQHFWLKIIKFF